MKSNYNINRKLPTDQTTAFAGHVLSRVWSLNWNTVNMGSLHCHVPSRNSMLIYGAHERPCINSLKVSQTGTWLVCNENVFVVVTFAQRYASLVLVWSYSQNCLLYHLEFAGLTPNFL